MSFASDKEALRASCRRVRERVLPVEAADAARVVSRRALIFVESFCARTGISPEETPVALYSALAGELDCMPLLEALAERKYPTLLPFAGVKATPLIFRLWKPGDALVVGRYRLREPAATAPAMTPKILFAPLLAFDEEGTRLGFGGGYYDATLAELRAKGLRAAGGLAFACQKAEKIPRQAHDEGLDFVVTEEKVFQFTESA